MIGCGELKRKECSIEERIGKYEEDVVRKTCRSTSELCEFVVCTCTSFLATVSLSISIAQGHLYVTGVFSIHNINVTYIPLYSCMVVLYKTVCVVN